MDLRRGEGRERGVKGRRGNTWSGGEAGEPHQWRSAGSASSSKEWHPGVEHEAEAEAALMASQRKQTREQCLQLPEPSMPKTSARSSSGRPAMRSSPPTASTTEARSCGVIATTVGGGAEGLRQRRCGGARALEGGVGGSAKEGAGGGVGGVRGRR